MVSRGVKAAGLRLAKAKHMLDNAWVTIITTKPVEGAIFTDNEPVVIVKDYPARVIKGGLSSQQQAEFLPDTYDAVLVIDTGIDIPAGCTIYAKGLDDQVTQFKRATRGYAGYVSHQEVAMVLSKEA